VPVRTVRESAPAKVEPTPTPVAETSAKPMRKAVAGDAKTTFGLFLRSLRKTSKNGVLFTMCMDLDCAYEEGVFVLYTQSETIYNSLQKPDRYDFLKGAFEAIGMFEGSFAVKLAKKPSEGFQKAVEEIKQTFDGVKIEVK
jgi:hypothetical protein